MFSIVKNYLKENTGILIRIDDVCENMYWNKMRHLESLFEKYSIKPVICNSENKDDFFNYPRNENFWEQIRKWDKMGWKLQCMVTRIFMTGFVKKQIILIMVVEVNFLIIQ